MPMDVRSIEDVEPVVEHNGTVPVWWLVNPREMKEITDGGFLELVSEFEGAGGGGAGPSHFHPHARVLFRPGGPGDHDHRRRGVRDPSGRPGAHSARHGAQP